MMTNRKIIIRLQSGGPAVLQAYSHAGLSSILPNTDTFERNISCIPEIVVQISVLHVFEQHHRRLHRRVSSCRRRRRSMFGGGGGAAVPERRRDPVESYDVAVTHRRQQFRLALEHADEIVFVVTGGIKPDESGFVVADSHESPFRCPATAAAADETDRRRRVLLQRLDRHHRRLVDVVVCRCGDDSAFRLTVRLELGRRRRRRGRADAATAVVDGRRSEQSARTDAEVDAAERSFAELAQHSDARGVDETDASCIDVEDTNSVLNSGEKTTKADYLTRDDRCLSSVVDR